MIRIKRAYEKPVSDDGYRVLVDRIWPRGKSKKQLALDEWDKIVAPSTALRKSFNHDPKRWISFQSRFRKELHANLEAKEVFRRLARLSRTGTVTLVYAARDERHNQAVVIKQMIEESGK